MQLIPSLPERFPQGQALRFACALTALTLSGALAQPVPAPFSHIFVIVLENHSVENVIGNPRLPTLNRLAKEGALATNNHGVAHPSLPNYVALIAGSTFGSRSDNPNQTFSGPTLADELEKAGLTWKGYFQSMPQAGYTGSSGGPFGVYVKRHNPFMLFPAIADNPSRAARSVPLSQLAEDLKTGQVPNFALIVPDNCHNLHLNINCVSASRLAADADAFVGQWVKAIQSNSAWDDRAAIVITFDEAEGQDRRGGGGRIPAIVLTKTGPRGFQNNRSYNHYSLLRTLTDTWGLPPLGESRNAAPMNELFFK